LIAATTSGCFTMLASPIAAMVANHTAIAGAKTLPTRCVPKRWMPNSATSVAIESHGTNGAQRGVMTSSPSQADMIESDGVITPSPRMRPEPMTAISTMRLIARTVNSFAARDLSSARIENIPPSPWLSARRIKITYLSVTTSAIAQKNIEVQPRTSSRP